MIKNHGMISYVDVLTLLITLFVLLLAYSKVSSLDQGEPNKGKLPERYRILYIFEHL